MRFFVGFLKQFDISELLQMFADGAFRSSEEIRMVDDAIENKVLMQNEVIPAEYSQVYKYFQRIIGGMGAHYNSARLKNLGITLSNYSEDDVDFNYFIRYGEVQREISKLNIVERRFIFAFKPREVCVDLFSWSQAAINELLNYILRDFKETDRIGFIVRNEQEPDMKLKFPIKLKSELHASAIMERLEQLFFIGSPHSRSESMTLQLMRLRNPRYYRLFDKEDLDRGDEPFGSIPLQL